jgi:hypothetical protein
MLALCEYLTAVPPQCLCLVRMSSAYEPRVTKVLVGQLSTTDQFGLVKKS